MSNEKFDGKFIGSNSPLRKPLAKIEIKKGKKNKFIEKFRVKDELFDDYEKAIAIYFKNKGITDKNKYNHSEFKTYIFEKGLSNINNTKIVDASYINEVKFLAMQVNKIGNNINHIAHALNILKRKKQMTKDDKVNILNFYPTLKEFSISFSLITKKISKFKF